MDYDNEVESGLTNGGNYDEDSSSFYNIWNTWNSYEDKGERAASTVIHR